ncbi:SAM-dependent methyltransferase [Paraburkholderia phosphatilytica]|uniref:SAM-dependent methyltransferase n=1 Tax=Paraburkholderia phosphatilytica TaxID=2282883 RepID=UPI000E49D83D|nr:SAM-dependent methyltransferase [Paraburkholderia phosphatilytica]
MSATTTATICDAAYFDALYATSDDPWDYRGRWYESRKRQLALACLPRERYRSGFEPACSNGELAASLAPRCDALLCADLNARAVELATQRCKSWPHVRVEQRTMPTEWPDDGRFDLIVISELLYYLTTQATAQLAALAQGSLAKDGTLLACHWTHPFEGALQSARQAHAAFDACMCLTKLVRHMEADLLLEVWSNDARPVAAREGIA